MTKQEILSALDAVGNQGNQLDLTGNLVDAIRGIVDLIPEGGGGSEVKTVILTEYGLSAAFSAVSHDPEYDSIDKLIRGFESGKIRILIDQTSDQYRMFEIVGSEHDMMVMWGVNVDSLPNPTQLKPLKLSSVTFSAL